MPTHAPTHAHPAPTADQPAPVHRFEVRPRPGVPDARANSVAARAKRLGYPVANAASAKVYLIQAHLTPEALRRVTSALLTDAVVEVATPGAAPVAPGAQLVEVHPLPGVMDPSAQSVREAIMALLGEATQVSTGVRFDLEGVSPEQAGALGERLLANKVIHQVCRTPFHPASLPVGRAYELVVTTVPLTSIPEGELEKFSRESHLFLSVPELRAVQSHFAALGRDPTDIELETIAQTWSEHCVHKTLKSRVQYKGPAKDTITWAGRPGVSVGDDGVTIDNLLKSTVAAATRELIDDGLDWALSVFKDNSGVVAFDEDFGVNIKVETHNRPSAIEPYGGAATGIGGCIRDVIATGLGAKPIASSDVFCVAPPTAFNDGSGQGRPLPPNTLHPRRILDDVVAGVRDYGNRMGIPTVNGAVYFDDRYVGNPLVFCGCVGLIPRSLVTGRVQAGHRIVALGGKTGRDGVHGATFSSAELQHTHADEFAHAVQIGNAIEEKRLLDALLRARDAGPLYAACTDCGAGGFSSAIGELAGALGAEVHLDRAPTKYDGLSYTEVWISEAQERLVLAVPEANLPALQAICDEEGVELADLGHFGTPDATLDLYYQGTRVGCLDAEFLHAGLPMPTRAASWTTPPPAPAARGVGPTIADALAALIAHPNLASKHTIIRQYDHEVQGRTVVKPLVGPGGRGPSDAAVLQPVPGKPAGIALACGLAPALGDRALGGDPYEMALAGIDECVRNLVCVGANPSRTAILDNFCWPSCDRPENMGALVRACMGCYDGAIAYRTPFVSGKDSLNNQLRYNDPATGETKLIEIPTTLLITGLARCTNVDRAVTMDAKRAGNLLVLVGQTGLEMGASHYQRLYPTAPVFMDARARAIPRVDLAKGPAAARAVAQAITDGLVQSAHDCSDGGLLCAVAEMLIATTGTAPGKAPAQDTSALGALLSGADSALAALGAELTIDDDVLDPAQVAFAETPSRYVLEVRPDDLTKLRTVMRDYDGTWVAPIGKLNASGRLAWTQGELNVGVNDLAQAWLTGLSR